VVAFYGGQKNSIRATASCANGAGYFKVEKVTKVFNLYKIKFFSCVRRENNA